MNFNSHTIKDIAAILLIVICLAFVIALNLSYRRDRERMSPEERAKEDRQASDFWRNW